LAFFALTIFIVNIYKCRYSTSARYGISILPSQVLLGKEYL